MSVAPVNQNSTINNDQPYPLPYDLRARIVSNIFFWSSIVLTLTIIPIIIYYPLIYLTSLSIGDVLGIVSIPNGLPSLIHLPMRLWKLWKQDDGDRRPLSGNIMDLFMWEYSISFIIIAAFYTVSTTIPIP